MHALLTIELVPRTAWGKNVRALVSADEWRRLRALTLERADFQCEICGAHDEKRSGAHLECHELWHYDDARRVQTLVRLVSLCRACHEVKHIGLAGVRGRQSQALRHLAGVNRWSLEDARHYLEASFELYHRRSQHEWTLDLDYLKQFSD